MQLIDDLAHTQLDLDTVLTVGAFDGVHLGHQALIRHVVARARATGRLAGVVTFHPHPAHTLANSSSPKVRLLTSPGEKLSLLEQMGVDFMVLLRFDEALATTPARPFMEALVQRLRLRELWVGRDFALGRQRSGDIAELRSIGHDLGFTVGVIEHVTNAPATAAASGKPISSSRIRRLLAEGNVRTAAHLLGRYPTVWGEVVHGAERGRKLGYPTANLEVRPERAVPANGVYAVFAWLGPEHLAGVANIGVRPSFDNGALTIEAHLFDFERDIYGCELVIEFVDRLRPELRFENVDALVAQMDADCQTARCLLQAEADTAIATWRTITGCREEAHAVRRG